MRRRLWGCGFRFFGRSRQNYFSGGRLRMNSVPICCLKCDEWNHKTSSCDFGGICDHVAPEAAAKQDELIYGPKDVF